VIFKNDLCKVFHDDKGLFFTTHMSKNRMSAPTIIPMCLKTTKQEATLLGTTDMLT
jgi:hypothetical protein